MRSLLLAVVGSLALAVPALADSCGAITTPTSAATAFTGQSTLQDRRLAQQPGAWTGLGVSVSTIAVRARTTAGWPHGFEAFPQSEAPDAACIAATHASSLAAK